VYRQLLQHTSSSNRRACCCSHLPLTQVIDFLQRLRWQKTKSELLLLLLHDELLLPGLDRRAAAQGVCRKIAVQDLCLHCDVHACSAVLPLSAQRSSCTACQTSGDSDASAYCM
jgi:hypothetical protein